MTRFSRFLNADDSASSLPLPGLRPGVVLVGEGEDAELRDMRLGQVVRLGTVAAAVVALLDGTRDAEALLRDASRSLGEDLNPLGLVELLRALDRRALLDTPRARMVVAQGLVRADIAALQRLAKRARPIRDYSAEEAGEIELEMAPNARFTCQSCNRCCTDKHLLGPISLEDRDNILRLFDEKGDAQGSDPSNFVPLATGDAKPVFLLRPRGGNCSYLRGDGLCKIHAELGLDHKPAVCRLFPYRATQTPSGWSVGMSLYCPTVAAGRGPDPREDARQTVGPLRVLSTQLKVLSDRVPASENVSVSWAQYHAWEGRALRLICDERRDPGEAWMEAIESYLDLVEDCSDASEVGLGTLELPDPELLGPEAKTETAPAGDFVPAAGVGEQHVHPRGGVDILLRDLALWSELLTGLEAADPDAIRRFRSGLLRLRHEVGHKPDAAPVLAELCRLRFREADVREAMEGRQPTLDDEDEDEKTQPSLPNVSLVRTSGADPGLQRRFLTQALLDKRAFEYGTVARGLLVTTVLFAVLRLKMVQGDELHPRVSDLAYLVHHPQLCDVMDTRATVRMHSEERGAYRALLNLD